MMNCIDIKKGSEYIEVLIDDEIERLPLIVRLNKGYSFVHCLHYLNYYQDAILEIDVRQDTGEVQNIQLTSGDLTILEETGKIETKSEKTGIPIANTSLWLSNDKYVKEFNQMSIVYTPTQIGIFWANRNNPKINYVINGKISFAVLDNMIAGVVINELKEKEIQSFVKSIGVRNSV